MEEKQIRVAVVDDHRLFRKGIISSLADYPDIIISFEAENGRDLINKLHFKPTDVILLDIKMPEMSGTEALRLIRSKNTDVKVIILSMHDEDAYINKMFEEQANAYLLKDSSADELYYAIQYCYQHGHYFSETVNSTLLKQLYEENKLGQGFQKKPIQFNEKEMMILQLVCQEKSSQEIADITGINCRTVERTRANMQDKIGVKNAIGLAIYATKHNLIKDP